MITYSFIAFKINGMETQLSNDLRCKLVTIWRTDTDSVIPILVYSIRFII